jgi:hypothetical protein
MDVYCDLEEYEKLTSAALTHLLRALRTLRWVLFTLTERLILCFVLGYFELYLRA